MSFVVETPSAHTSGKCLSFQIRDSLDRLRAHIELDVRIKRNRGITPEESFQYENACNMLQLSANMSSSLGPLFDDLRGVYPVAAVSEKENENPKCRIDLISRLTALRLWAALLQQLITIESYAWDDVNKEKLLPKQVTVFDMATKATHSTVMEILFDAYPGMKDSIDDKVKNAHRKVVELSKAEQQL